MLVQAVVSLVAVELPDLAAGVEGGDDGGVLHPRPVLDRPSSGSPSPPPPPCPHLDGEDEGILGELLRRVGEGEVAVQTQPRVVKPETHEGKQKVDLLVNLGDCVTNVLKMYKMYEDISRYWTRLDKSQSHNIMPFRSFTKSQCQCKEN